MRILLTCFEPFGKINTNSSFEIVQKINKTISKVEIKKVTLPVEYSKTIYLELLQTYEPDILLLCGQAEGRKNVSIEMVAINLMISGEKDNKGYMKSGEKIFLDGPDAFFSSIDVLGISDKLNKKSMQVNTSLSAGGYICNLSLYASLYYAKKYHFNTKIGFIHFPLLDIQTKDPDIPFIEINKAEEILNQIIKQIIKDYYIS